MPPHPNGNGRPYTAQLDHDFARPEYPARLGSLNDRRITACIPYHECRRFVRRAVLSLLNQSHRNLIVIVVNDGDPRAPWDLLADIRDPRLVRFDMRRNRGPYFATATVLNATRAPYLLIQDADDWSDPRRVETLLDRLQRDGSDLAISAQPQYMEDARGSRVLDVRWEHVSDSAVPGKRFVVARALAARYVYRAPHHGLFVTSSLRHVGGYYAGFRVGYDTLLTNLMLMTGRISHVSQPLYFRQVRPESLTHSADTGTNSAHGTAAHEAIVHMYRRCYLAYSRFVAGRIDSQQLGENLREIIGSNVTASERDELRAESVRLRHFLVEHGIERAE